MGPGLFSHGRRPLRSRAPEFGTSFVHEGRRSTHPDFEISNAPDLTPRAATPPLKISRVQFPPGDREPMRWDNWTMQADGGTDGRDVVEPSGWLLAYWMGRFHGFIAPPKQHTDPEIQI